MISKLLLLSVVLLNANQLFASGKIKPASARTLTACEGPGWIAYKDEKCFKLIQKFSTRQDAVEICEAEALPNSTSNVPTLAMVKTPEEQAFLSKYIFETSDVMSNVWIGAQNSTGDGFEWDDGTEVIYANWAVGSPTGKPRRECVEMQSEYNRKLKSGTTQSGSNFGAGVWRDAPCGIANFVVCQKMQPWSMTKLQQVLLDARNNPVPIGFIYVQLPSEKSPSEIWPATIWTDVSSSYAGVFFRVTGGDAASFGTVQGDNGPRIDKVETAYYGDVSGMSYCNRLNCPLPKGDWSLWHYTGSSSGTSRYTRFYTTSGEVRPRNMAMRVWKRTA